MTRIALDAMGGDHAPLTELRAVAQALGSTHASELTITLVGDEPQLRAGMASVGLVVGERLAVQHASQVITMDDAPSVAVRGKRDSSMRICFDLVKDGRVDAVVSAGHSGAMLAAGTLLLGRLPGVDRPGIVTTFPTLKGPCVLCDMGANVEVRAATLAQFGVLGAVFARVVHGRPRPRVGLLANGEEAHKGTELTRAASAALRELAAQPEAGFDYLGYVEGSDIFSGDVDVVATDGFTGNVVLKTAEGTAAALMALLKEAMLSTRLAKLGAMLAAPALRRLRARVDYAEVGGAPLLGVDGVVVICHGKSSPRALERAILGAAAFARGGLVAKVGEAVARSSGVAA
jgi:glycerol-3-phosphate acyltransferase PlsX